MFSPRGKKHMEREWKIGERREHGDNLLWFDRLTGPKQIQAIGNIVSVRVGYNRVVESNGKTKLVPSTIEIDGRTVGEALRYARLEYEFLTIDTLTAA
jgi:hypothetical protein